MSKAFTREDDGVGFEAPPSPPPRASVAPVIVRVVELRPLAGGAARTVRIVAAGDPAHVPGGCSVASPLGSALEEAEAGEIVEIASPRGTEEFEVLAVDPPGRSRAPGA